MNIEHCHVFSFTYFNVKTDVILSFIKDTYKDDLEKSFATLTEESLNLDTFISNSLWINPERLIREILIEYIEEIGLFITKKEFSKLIPTQLKCYLN